MNFSISNFYHLLNQLVIFLNQYKNHLHHFVNILIIFFSNLNFLSLTLINFNLLFHQIKILSLMVFQFLKNYI